MSKLLLLSNSTMPGSSFFSWPRPWVKKFLGRTPGEIVFIPFAAVSISFDAYFEKVSEAFEFIGYPMKALHQAGDKKALIREADVIVVGGGNTFALLSKMYEEDMVAEVQSRVRAGARYIGWSAGANLACPTLKTTNDMPIAMPPTFDALKLVPFQINPHYHELKFQNQGGETRRERLEEFLVLNPLAKVIGLPEGMLLERDGQKLTLHGEGTAKLYQSGKDPIPLRGETDLGFLLA
ncbi:MAG TPA: dipeptidase PepE [Chryseosolibacter sp.]